MLAKINKLSNAYLDLHKLKHTMVVKTLDSNVDELHPFIKYSFLRNQSQVSNLRINSCIRTSNSLVS